MTPAVEEALLRLRRTGSLTLSGVPSGHSRALPVLFAVLICMVGIVGLAPLALLPMFILSTGGLPLGALLGLAFVVPVAVGGVVVLVKLRRRQVGFREAARAPVVLTRAGLTMSGIGPLPWEDLAQAEYTFVQPQHDSGRELRWIIRLTPSGMHNVTTRMPKELRDRISHNEGTIFSGPRHTWIHLPAVEEFSRGEMGALVNNARHALGR